VFSYETRNGGDEEEKKKKNQSTILKAIFGSRDAPLPHGLVIKLLQDVVLVLFE
jgi:hypothetical protein